MGRAKICPIVYNTLASLSRGFLINEFYQSKKIAATWQMLKKHFTAARIG